jgi:hypothetical protein
MAQNAISNRVATTSPGTAFSNDSRIGPRFLPLLDCQDGQLEGADSESVDELLEEGNAFEAGVVSGVEHAEDDEKREVQTHEVPEDDVPEEYQDEKDS